MVILENDIFQQLKLSPLIPGTILLDVKTCPSGKANVVKIALMVIRKPEGWTTPVYVPILGQLQNGKLRWDLCPWISDQILNELSTLVPPTTLFSRLTPEDNKVLADKSVSLWAKV